jgi:hypothetical protein
MEVRRYGKEITHPYHSLRFRLEERLLVICLLLLPILRIGLIWTELASVRRI